MSCDCNTLVVGEAGVQGPQGLSGINGTNGANGVNAYTTTTASFAQPAVNSSVNITVANSSWIAVGQYIYIQATGYYLVNTVPTSTSINATLKIYETAPASTITSNKKVTPSGSVLFNGSLTTLVVSNLTGGDNIINNNKSNINTRIAGDNDDNALYVKGSSDYVGIGTSTPETKLQVVGDFKVGNSTTKGAITVTKGGTVNSEKVNTASGGTFQVYGTSATPLIYTNATNNQVDIGTTTYESGKILNVSGATKLGGTLEVTGASNLGSVVINGASQLYASLTSNSAITTTGAVSGLSYQTATGSGAAKLTKFFYYTPADITITSLADGDIISTEYTTGITGLLTTDFIQVSAQSSITNFYTKCIVSAAVSDTTKIAVTILNKTGVTITSSSVSIKLLVTRAAAS
jgi:hypothetical protein